MDVAGFYSDATPAVGVGHTSFTPQRLLDTRPGTVAVNPTKGQIAGQTDFPLQVAGLGTVPAGATGVVLNVTAVNPAADGFIAAYPGPCGPANRPTVSNVNFRRGQIVPNSVSVKVGTSGVVCFYSNVTTDLIVDFNASFGTGTLLRSATPLRVVDTRPGEPAALGHQGEADGPGAPHRPGHLRGARQRRRRRRQRAAQRHRDAARRGRVPGGLPVRHGAADRVERQLRGRRDPTQPGRRQARSAASRCAWCPTSAPTSSSTSWAGTRPRPSPIPSSPPPPGSTGRRWRVRYRATVLRPWRGAAALLLVVASCSLDAAVQAAPTLAATRPRVSLIGDSVAASIAASGPARGVLAGVDLAVDARVCRRTATTGCPWRGEVAASVADVVGATPGDLGDAVVIVSGYNDDARRFRRDATGVLTQLAAQGVPADRVARPAGHAGHAGCDPGPPPAPINATLALARPGLTAAAGGVVERPQRGPRRLVLRPDPPPRQPVPWSWPASSGLSWPGSRPAARRRRAGDPRPLRAGQRRRNPARPPADRHPAAGRDPQPAVAVDGAGRHAGSRRRLLSCGRSAPDGSCASWSRDGRPRRSPPCAPSCG